MLEELTHEQMPAPTVMVVTLDRKDIERAVAIAAFRKHGVKRSSGHVVRFAIVDDKVSSADVIYWATGSVSPAATP